MTKSTSAGVQKTQEATEKLYQLAAFSDKDLDKQSSQLLETYYFRRVFPLLDFGMNYLKTLIFPRVKKKTNNLRFT